MMARFQKQQSNSDTLQPTWKYYVDVCSFTFVFSSRAQIEEYLAHFRCKIHPSSADGADRPHEYNDEEGRFIGWNPGDHWERQSRFNELPLYLFEEPKRLKVIKALERALALKNFVD
jgi:hypothetical protein